MSEFLSLSPIRPPVQTLEGSAPRGTSGAGSTSHEASAAAASAREASAAAAKVSRANTQFRAMLLKELLKPLSESLGPGGGLAKGLVSNDRAIFGSRTSGNIYEFFWQDALAGHLEKTWPLPGLAATGNTPVGDASGNVSAASSAAGTRGAAMDLGRTAGVADVRGAGATRPVPLDPTRDVTSMMRASPEAGALGEVRSPQMFSLDGVKRVIAATSRSLDAAASRGESAPGSLDAVSAIETAVRSAHARSAGSVASGAAESADSVRTLSTRASRIFEVSRHLIEAVILNESSGRPTAVSPKGALGLMQLMPGTAREMGIDDPFDPWQNVYAGTKYLREQIDRFGDLEKAVAAYNAGPGAVTRHGGVPPYRETREYVGRVLRTSEQLARQDRLGAGE